MFNGESSFVKMRVLTKFIILFFFDWVEEDLEKNNIKEFIKAQFGVFLKVEMKVFKKRSLYNFYIKFIHQILPIHKGHQIHPKYKMYFYFKIVKPNKFDLLVIYITYN